MLFDWPNESAIQNIAAYTDADWARGLKVYQANGHALACSALRAAYPVVAQLLGDESFDALAKALWHAQPPRCGDAAAWGEGLADFVRASTQLASEPYLGDVAALEWALPLLRLSKARCCRKLLAFSPLLLPCKWPWS